MQYDNLLNEWEDKEVTQYGGQCVALVAQYCVENNKPIVWGNAIDWANNPIMLNAFDWILNNPSDYNQVPARGDIVIWKGSLPGSGGYGHIAIFDEVLGPDRFQSFDQNWGGANAHFQEHHWDYVLGWYTPKAEPINPVAPHPDPAPSNSIEPTVVAPAPVVSPPPVPEPVVVTPEPLVTVPVETPPARPVEPVTPEIPVVTVMADKPRRLTFGEIVADFFINLRSLFHHK